jgi:hypothetical protein
VLVLVGGAPSKHVQAPPVLGFVDLPAGEPAGQELLGVLARLAVAGAAAGQGHHRVDDE